MDFSRRDHLVLSFAALAAVAALLPATVIEPIDWLHGAISGQPFVDVTLGFLAWLIVLPLSAALIFAYGVTLAITKAASARVALLFLALGLGQAILASWQLGVFA